LAVPRVALGLFVYNGERHLAAAIDSLLAQSMGDFVLDISDNASTDATEEICRSYGSLDPRIRYVRHGENRGAAWNCNFVAQASPETEFFRWCAHDDIVDPIYLQECMDLLDGEPELVCSHSRTRYINSAVTSSSDRSEASNSAIVVPGSGSIRSSVRTMTSPMRSR
jgi:GT2 family glycosyltransferase